MAHVPVSDRPASGRAPVLVVQGLAVAALVVGLAALPEVLTLYWVRVLTNVLMFAVIAQGINIIAGFVGYPAFGNVVFFGIGAYGAGVAMMKLEAPFVVGLAMGLAICACVVVVIGPPLFRLRGHYFAIATLGLNEATGAIVENLTGITGGGMGLSLPLPAGSVEETAALFYRAFLVLVGIGLALTWLMQRTRFGYACRAIRANEEGAEAVGIDTTWYKTVAWLLSALLTGAAGSLYAVWLSYIEPSAVFSMTIAVKAFVMFLLGGAGTLIGPITGAALVEIITTLTWSHLLEYHLAVLGVIIMAIVILLPNGMDAYVRDRFARGVALFRSGR